MNAIQRITVLLVLAISLMASGCAPGQLFGPTVTPTPTLTATATNTPVPPTATDTPEPPTVAPTPTPSIGSKWISPKDGMVMVYVPADNFLMGAVDSDPNPQANAKPQHTVYLDAFWIDQTDVTNAMYAKCVSASTCEKPISARPYADPYSNSLFYNHPVVYVNWYMADTYCKWAGRQLPTEAQWEKAARGTDGRIYPWGNNAPTTKLLNFGNNIGDTTEVGKYPNGASIYGALDMEGNVTQWVADWYSDTYYQNSPVSNPLGPDSGQYRVSRGGSCNSGQYYIGSAIRIPINPKVTDYEVGFRCSRSNSSP